MTVGAGIGVWEGVVVMIGGRMAPPRVVVLTITMVEGGELVGIIVTLEERVIQDVLGS